MKEPRLLLINPWIDDFAAFDLWMKPLGLLYVAGYLRHKGYALHLLDCLDRRNPDVVKRQGLTTPRMRAYGTGKFFRQSIQKPPALQAIPFPYRRYGMPEEIFIAMLKASSRPDAILVTSMMTYWYPGVFRAIELAKQHFPDVPVVLGGVYAALCAEHARSKSGADYVIQTRELVRIGDIVDEITGTFLSTPAPSQEGNSCGGMSMASSLEEEGEGDVFPSWEGTGMGFCQISPAYDLYQHLDYACILTSTGCPYRCTYCASHLLCPEFVQRNPADVFEEIRRHNKHNGIQHIAFYDDALLVNSEQHLEPLLERIIEAQLGLTLHTPNGLHARYITERVAHLMFQAGFKTVRVSLETVDPDRQQQSGGKVTAPEFERAVHFLKLAGFQGHQIGVYLFVGLPGQRVQETEQTIRFVHRLGLLANLCEYSPIPGTQDWNRLKRQGSMCSEDDPLIHNNSVFLYLKERHTFEQIQGLKDLVRSLNKAVKAAS